MVAPFWIVEAKSTADPPYLDLHNDDDGEVSTLNQSISSVLQRSEQVERLVEREHNLERRFGKRGIVHQAIIAGA
jgi:hypothetical protein